jgi:hypothetical protein
MELQSFPLVIKSWFLSYKRFIAPITWYSVGALLVCGTGVLVACGSAGGIVVYKPSEFTEQASAPFFFSVGEKLKYGTAISEEVPTVLERQLFGGELRAVYPSPDQTKAAAVTGGKLYLVEPGKPPGILLDPFISWLEGRKIPIGETYYNDAHIQWDPASRFIFITRDKIQEPPMNPESFHQRNNMNQALIRIDTTQSHSIVEVIPAGQFRTTFGPLFIGDDVICFDSGDDKGDVYLKCIVAGKAHIVQTVGPDKTVFTDGLVLNGRMFMTSRQDHVSGDVLMVESGFHMTKRKDSLVVDLLHKNRPDSPMLSVEGAIDKKGQFRDGVQGTVLPGGRYAFLHVWNKNILLDSETGFYKELPTNTRVYHNVNSRDHKSSFFMGRFEPTSLFRTNYAQ